MINTEQPIERATYQEDLPGLGLELMSLSRLYADYITANPQKPKPIKLDFYQVLILTQGHGAYMVDFQDYAFQAGTVFTLRIDQVQQFSSTLSGEGWLLAFTESFITPYFEGQQAFHQLSLFNDALLRPCFQLTHQQLADVENLIGQLQTEYSNPVRDRFQADLLKSGLFSLLLTLERYKRLSEPPASHRLYLESFLRFKELVETHCFTMRNVEQYARMLGFSSKKLNYITRHVVGKPAKEYITYCFLLRVKRVLISSDVSLKELAYQSGFDEPTNFSNYFKRYSGQKPTQFRKTSYQRI